MTTKVKRRKRRQVVYKGVNELPDVSKIKEDSLFPYLALPDRDLRLHFSSRSPLRYPGGKTRAVEIITKFIPASIKEICSPFFGGGSIELYCAAKGIKVYGYDIFNPLVEFWQCLSECPGLLADEVERYYPLPKKDFYRLQEAQIMLPTKLERAATFYVLNRCSFSGSTLSGGMSPKHPRFTLTAIQRLRNFYNPNFHVEEMDFHTSIPLNYGRFLYLDPPYLTKHSLYGRNGDAHRHFDHNALFDLLSNRDNWILSYNNCAEIRTLYKEYKIISLNWTYGMSNDKNSKEVLILSKSIQKTNNL